jgi:hypothetical protein
MVQEFVFFSIGGHGKLNQEMVYTTLAWICSKEHLYLFFPLFDKNFQIVFVIKEEMSCLRTSTWYKLASTSLESYHKGYIVIQSLNTFFDLTFWKDFSIYSNMWPSHILCLNETRIQNIHTNQSILNALSKKLTFCHVTMDTKQWYFMSQLCP